MLKQEYRSIVTILLLVAVVALFSACTPSPAQPGAAQTEVTENQGVITVVGHGEAFGQPDEASLQLGVETFAENVTDATNQNEESVQSIMSALESLGIAAEDIQTSNYSLWADQRYGENGPEGIIGYRVSNLVSVTIRDIERVGEVIAAVTAAGANNIHGIAFNVADPAALEAEAREAAIANAREKAASLADLSGVELGEVVAVSEVFNHPGVVFEGMGGARSVAADSAAASISPGELAVGVQVQVTFAIR